MRKSHRFFFNTLNQAYYKCSTLSMIALASRVNHLQQIHKAQVCAKDLMFVVHVSKEVSYGVSLVPWTECPLAAGPCPCFWTASSSLIVLETLSSLWQLCSVKQGGMSEDGWDPNQCANMDSFCLNVAPFGIQRALIQTFSYLQMWLWWTLVSRK